MIPIDYIVNKFYEYNGGVHFNKFSNCYQGSCYICKEGKSWLKKKRCYFLVDKNSVCCHNCGWFSSGTSWVMEVAGLSFKDVLQDSKGYDNLPSSYKEDEKLKIVIKNEPLPKDSINLLDINQVSFYKKEPVVIDALKLIKSRNLFNAVNRPRSLWLSLTDFVHKDRLIIPFYNKSNEIVYYQTRSIYPNDDRPKYLCKANTPKSLYGIDRVSSNVDYIFIFEGPINAFFMKNSVAVCGIQENSRTNFTPTQQEQLRLYPLHKKVWVLDSQWKDNASLCKSEILINQNESVFIWPKEYGEKYKDFNDIIIDQKKNEIDIDFVLSNTASNLKAKMALSVIKSSRK